MCHKSLDDVDLRVVDEVEREDYWGKAIYNLYKCRVQGEWM